MNDHSSRTLKDLSVQNAAKFLQTVVVVDDKARLGPRPTNNGNSSLPSIAEEENESSAGAHANLVSPQPHAADPSVDPEDLDAKTLVDGFAKEGIACTVLRPVSEDDVVIQTTKITELADIVVLDWILDKDDGEKTTSLIQEIISEESGSDRIRLIAIYTGGRDLREVADKVSEVLSTRFGEAPDRPSDFVAVKGPVRLAVFGKAHTRVPPEDTCLSSRIVETSELPNRLIREFAEMTTGLLPNVAIAGLSEIRAQTHKLLTKFSRSLDPAYLGHRLLLPNPSDAEEEVVAMFVAEIFSILEHGNVAKQGGIASIRAWIDEMNANSSLRPLPLSETPQDAQDTLLGILEKGIYNTSNVSLGNWKWAQVTHAFTPEDSFAEESNRQFATMMHVKTRYRGRPPNLTLGTILFSKSDQCATFWICLQPKCDSVRIKERKSFPLVPMVEVRDQKCDFEIVVKHRGCWVLLRVPREPAEINMFTFEPDDASKEQVTATSNDSTWNFTPIEGPSFEWVAELKDEHAQRITNEFAASFSRVGVTVSEWVRKSGKSR